MSASEDKMVNDKLRAGAVEVSVPSSAHSQGRSPYMILYAYIIKSSMHGCMSTSFSRLSTIKGCDAFSRKQVTI